MQFCAGRSQKASRESNACKTAVNQSEDRISNPHGCNYMCCIHSRNECEFNYSSSPIKVLVIMLNWTNNCNHSIRVTVHKWFCTGEGGSFVETRSSRCKYEWRSVKVFQVARCEKRGEKIFPPHKPVLKLSCCEMPFWKHSIESSDFENIRIQPIRIKKNICCFCSTGCNYQ